jgi:hypothetical protein
MAWNHSWAVMWIVMAIPTVVLTMDFVYVTFTYKGQAVDHAHYIIQFMW